MVRVMLEPSAPSASSTVARLRSKPARSSSKETGTPVNSEADNIPWLYCTVGTATLPHSSPVLAPHSRKWMRDTLGMRSSSSIVKTNGVSTSPLIISLCRRGSMSTQP